MYIPLKHLTPRYRTLLIGFKNKPKKTDVAHKVYLDFELETKLHQLHSY